jgi:hypothetical protein
MDALFSTIFHGQRSKLHEKSGLVEDCNITPHLKVFGNDTTRAIGGI